jgi:hypothetical protein
MCLSASLETAIIGHLGLYFETQCAVLPVAVIQIIAVATQFNDAITAAIATAVVESVGVGVRLLISINSCSSVHCSFRF